MRFGNGRMEHSESTLGVFFFVSKTKNDGIFGDSAWDLP